MNGIFSRCAPLALFAFLSSACGAFPPLASPPILPPGTPLVSNSTVAPLRFEPVGNGIGISLFVQDERIRLGQPALVRTIFQPLTLRVSRRSDGSIEATSSIPWATPNVAEMQFCIAFDVPCELSGKWIPFDREQQVTLEGDWIGERDLWLKAQFRDGSGNLVSAFSLSTYELPQASAQTSARLVAVVDERTPLEALPANIQTLVAATRTAFPVTGYVRFENNRTLVGGKAGSTLEVKAQFGATSPFGQVKEMRVRNFAARQCASQSQMLESVWEPFVAEKTYKIGVAINFTSFDLSAQYRDEKGNLSQIYCVDLAVEGSP